MNITRELIEAVKRANDIVEVISKHITLKKKGKNLVGLCPFHEEKTPSFTVDPVKQIYHCFGCKNTGKGSTGGDVIGFVVKKDKISFTAAVIKLANEGGIVLEKQKSGARSQKSGEKQKQKKPVDSGNPGDTDSVAMSPKLQKLLNRVIEYYRAALFKDTRGLEYLQKERGIRDRQSIIDFGAGFASGNLLESLPSTGDIVEDLKTIGILNGSGREFFYGCVVFPLLDENNNVLSVYGRRIKDGEVTHLYLPCPKRGIINRQAAKRSKSLLLAESIIDGLSLYDAGFKNVIPCYGTNGLTEDHLFLFSCNGTERIYLCFDSDSSGKEATGTVSEQLKEKGITVYPVDLPEKDLNDFFKRHTPEEFENLLKSVNPNTLLRSETVRKREETFFSATDQGFVVGYGDRRYEVKAISRTGTQLRVTVKAFMLQTSFNDSRFEVTTVDMYSLRSRTWFAGLCSGLMGEAEELIREDLNRLLEKIESRSESSKEEKKEITITPDQKKEALRFLKNPEMLDEILLDFKTIGYVGEKMNKQILYLACVSRKLSKPLSVIIQSRSGAGKSTLQEVTLSLMPDEEYVQYTRLTDQALYYKDEDSLVHKILAIEEIAGVGGAAYSLRSIQSNGNIVVAYTAKDQLTGKMKTEEKRVNGPTPVLTTTANAEIDPELASRCIVTSVDESEEATALILQQQREDDTMEGYLKQVESEKIREKHKNAQRLLKSVTVFNPFDKDLRFNPRGLNARRDNKKYLILIKTVCFLHQYQREIKTLNAGGEIKEYMDVTIGDIEIANNIANEILGISLEDLCPQAKKLSLLIDNMVQEGKAAEIEKGLYGFNRRQLRNYTGWSDWQVKTYLKQLEDLEFVYVRQGMKGKEYMYEINYKGEGKEGQKFYIGLTDVKELRKKYPGRK